MTNRMATDRFRRFTLGRWVVLFALTASLSASCTRPPWPSTTTDGRRILDRLEERHRSFTTATYRVRWRAKGTDPHGEFVLDIAYKSPGLFRVSASGPLGLPAFTAVVRGDQFWFVDHPNKQLTVDSVQNLGDYELPLAEFFTGLWRDLFSGGWGGGEGAARLSPTIRRGWYESADGPNRVMLRWDEKHARPKEIVAQRLGETEITTAEILCRGVGSLAPWWELERLQLEGFPGGGTHTWILMSQKYNPEIPDRLFEPLGLDSDSYR
ncbi:MAG: hypothetical protein AB1752_09295 [Candidatus Zixiibacteriota bacterium]